MEQGKAVYAPKVKGDNLIFYKLNDINELIYGAFGIMEPLEAEVFKTDSAAFALVPCLAVNANGFRVGYGKGFYDRFLAEYPELDTAAIAMTER